MTELEEIRARDFRKMFDDELMKSIIGMSNPETKPLKKQYENKTLKYGVESKEDMLHRLSLLQSIEDVSFADSYLADEFPSIASYTGGMVDRGCIHWRYCLMYAPIEELEDALTYLKKSRAIDDERNGRNR